MTRIFNRGELKQVLLAIVASLGEGHGYAIMQELQQRVGHDWRPSPGAIYPALLALEESGLIESAEKDGLRTYRPTEQGKKALGDEVAAPAWQTLANRAGATKPRLTLGRLLERFEEQLPARRQPVSDEQAAAIDLTLDEAAEQIKAILEEGEQDG